ncbi:hypothetical protein V5799_019257, partial [Amblyomma americanum]
MVSLLETERINREARSSNKRKAFGSHHEDGIKSAASKPKNAKTKLRVKPPAEDEGGSRKRRKIKKEDEELLWRWYVAVKRQQEKVARKYGFCVVDGHRQKIANYKIEPPGLFCGRGEHPKMGMLKRRVMPEDVTINIG